MERIRGVEGFVKIVRESTNWVKGGLGIGVQEWVWEG